MLKIHVTRPIHCVINENPKTWNHEQINEYYDQNPNLLISDFARMLGITVRELKTILMGN